MARLKRTLVGFIFVAACASAAPLCTTVVATAADFQAQGNVGCQFGDKIFYGFTYSYTLQDSQGNPLAPNVPGASVAVQFSNLGSLVYQPVVSFIANWGVQDGQQGDVRISYNVQAPVQGAMIASTFSISGFASNIDPDNLFNSYISGAESVSGNTLNPVPLNTILQPPLTPSGSVFLTDYDIVHYAPQTQLSVTKDIFIVAGTDNSPNPGNTATLTRIDQGLIELTSIPEPFSFLLLGSGLVGMALLRKPIGKSKVFRRAL